MRYWESSKPKHSRRSTGVSSGKAPRGRGSASSGPTTAVKRSVTSTGSLLHYPFLRAFYQHQATIGVRLQRYLFFLIVSTLLYVFVFGDAGAIRILQLKHQKADLAATVAALDSDSARLQEAIDDLQSNPFAMEKIARERYGYIYPGDRVYKLVPFPEE